MSVTMVLVYMVIKFLRSLDSAAAGCVWFAKSKQQSSGYKLRRKIQAIIWDISKTALLLELSRNTMIS